MKLYMICALMCFFGAIGIWGQEAISEIASQATALSLTETFTSENGQVIFQYPEGWTIHPYSYLAEGVYFGALMESNQTTSISSQDDAEPVFLSISISEVTIFEPLGVSNSYASAIEIAETFNDFYLQLIDDGHIAYTFNIGQVVSLPESVKEAAQYISYYPHGYGGINLVAKEDKNVVAIFDLISSQSNVLQWEPTILAISNSLSYRPQSNTNTQLPLINPEISTIPLLETYMGYENSPSFRYPENWIIQDRSRPDTGIIDVSIANNDLVSRKLALYPNMLLLPNEVILSLTVGNQLIRFGMGEPISEDGFIKWLIDRHRYLGRNWTYGGIEAIQINDYSAAFTTAMHDGFERLTLITSYGDGVYSLIFLSAPYGELDQWIPTALAIAESIQFNEP